MKKAPTDLSVIYLQLHDLEKFTEKLRSFLNRMRLPGKSTTEMAISSNDDPEV